MLEACDTHGSETAETLMPCFHHSVAVLPLPFRRSRYLLPFPYPAAVAVAATVAYLYA